VRYDPRSPDDLEDAAFRARLAPLAAEVLPPEMSAMDRGLAPSPRSRVRGVTAGMVATIVALGVAGVLFVGSQFDRVAPGAPNPPVTQGAREEPAQRVAVEPGPDMIRLLLHRGDAAVTDGDIAAARLLYERAAAMGSGAAATSLGKTYDAEFLVRWGARGIKADPTQAMAWYRKGTALGDAEAGTRLARLEASK
jgi:hypothetical protein